MSNYVYIKGRKVPIEQADIREVTEENYVRVSEVDPEVVTIDILREEIAQLHLLLAEATVMIADNQFVAENRERFLLKMQKKGIKFESTE